MKTFISTKEASKLAGVSDRTIRRWLQDGATVRRLGQGRSECMFGWWNDSPQVRVRNSIFVEKGYFIDTLKELMRQRKLYRKSRS
jgi:hypothetical protein